MSESPAPPVIASAKEAFFLIRCLGLTAGGLKPSRNYHGLRGKKGTPCIVHHCPFPRRLLVRSKRRRHHHHSPKTPQGSFLFSRDASSSSSFYIHFEERTCSLFECRRRSRLWKEKRYAPNVECFSRAKRKRASSAYIVRKGKEQQSTWRWWVT